MAGHVGLELANVILGKSLKCWANSPWITRTFWDLRPYARELQQAVGSKSEPTRTKFLGAVNQIGRHDR